MMFKITKGKRKISKENSVSKKKSFARRFKENKSKESYEKKELYEMLPKIVSIKKKTERKENILKGKKQK